MEQNTQHNDTHGRKPRSARYIMGLIMIFVYFGMGILTLLGFFSWMPKWANWSLGCLFIAYGAWRCYRQLFGIDSKM